jgi:hypothetical protein
MSAPEDENKILFLLTYSFPWGDDHEFLEDEINYLATVFTKIHIFCLEPGSTNRRFRKCSVTPLSGIKVYGRNGSCYSLLIDGCMGRIQVFYRYRLKRKWKLMKVAMGSYLRAIEISHFISKNKGIF